MGRRHCSYRKARTLKNRPNQVRGLLDDRATKKADECQGLGEKSTRSKGGTTSLDVMAVASKPPLRRKKGGWQTTGGLRSDEVSRVFLLKTLAAENRTPLNRFVTIKPTGNALLLDDKACKRWLCNRAKSIIQAVRGYGKKPRQKTVPAVTIYEKQRGGVLHLHMLIHVAPANDALDRIADGLEIHGRKVHSNSADYITKSRLPMGDAVAEAANPHRRQGRQAAITGARISFNRDAAKLLAFEAAVTPTVVVEAVVVANPPQPASFARDPKDCEQVEMPFPQINLIALVEAKRQALGLPQREVAARLGVRQSHYANALRGHDSLSNRRRFLVLQFLAA